ncbi:Serine/threonine-protein kinase PknD [Usitatibacter rugosus]|uniref:Serine/threonine-protein kinase PknD n=1 Tax=Usitatibacter rugosus TaxID=2732067 RepID=A0A6M4GQ09_9PROT|nr:protein kinase [Usitatibacter rugosus]QJR09155.1 Serine/threonine-protein kinase PknD [Usitatibacter rugosus]
MKLPGRIGRYDVQSVLGKGAAGTVYRGFDSGIKRAVAIKVVVKGELDPSDQDYVLQRFRHEAQAVGRLMHPRIAAIYDFLEDDEMACIVMELVEGRPLDKHLHEVPQYGFREAWEILRQLLDGLAYSHAQGVLHRDLKPGNILVHTDGRIKITDFGVARLDNSTITQLGDIVGTPHYMAPEQFSGADSSERTDLYQVGVIAYELVTGARPFLGTNAEILRLVLNERPANPSQHNARITWGLDWAIQKSLSKDPADRFPTCKALAEALRKGLEESLGGAMATTRAAANTPLAAPVGGATTLLDKARLLAGAKEAGLLTNTVSGDLKASTFIAPGDPKKARVLFVDDEERILNALRTVFRSQYHVFTAENGTLALEFVKRFGIHVVVSDQRMPGMSGVELLRQVREAAPATVRILLTGYSDLAAIVGSINDGEVFRFVKKPWDNADLQKTLADGVAIALELAAAATDKPAVPEKFEGSVLVIEPANEVTDGLRQLFAGSAGVHHVDSPMDAVKVMENEPVAVIVADLASSREGLSTLFKLLKVERPEILAILVSDTPDSELAIELINEAQLYRLLAKPIDARQLRVHVDAALRRHALYKQRPSLTKQHKVEENGLIETSLWGARLLDRVRSLSEK